MFTPVIINLLSFNALTFETEVRTLQAEQKVEEASKLGAEKKSVFSIGNQ